jgi:dynein heavy chain
MQVESGMIESVRASCAAGLTDYATTPRATWVLQWPGQVVLAVTGVYWTRSVGTAIEGGTKGALQGVADTCTTQLNEVVGLVRGELSNLNRCDRLVPLEFSVILLGINKWHLDYSAC